MKLELAMTKFGGKITCWRCMPIEAKVTNLEIFLDKGKVVLECFCIW